MAQIGNRTKGDTAYLYTQGTAGSTAVGVDSADGDKFKIAASATSGVQPSSTAQLTIDPSANGDITIDPNGTGDLVISSLTTGLVTTDSSGRTDVINGSNGQIPIGATGGSPVFASLTSGDGSITFTPGVNSLSLQASSTTALSFPTDSGTATPAANALTIHGTHNINTTGAGSTVTVQNNNTATFGDLSVVAAGSPSLTLTTGDLTLSGTGVTGANINLPATSSTGAKGVIKFDSIPYIHQWNGAGINSNIFVGYNAGNFTSTGSRNSVIGQAALASLTSGNQNTMCGDASGQNLTSGSLNSGLGLDAIGGISGPTTGSRNTGLGAQALGKVTSGQSNSAVGALAGLELLSGSNNIALGSTNSASSGGALGRLTTGSNNICIGSATAAGSNGAGYNYTGAESSNICVGGATTGTLGESNVMRLGTSGSGDGQVNKAFIGGTYGATYTAGTNPRLMQMDDAGQANALTSLGADFTFTSSTAGTVRTLTVSNTDNTNASSAGLLQLTVGGASAGDPRQTYTVSGATSFTTGIDNSASDAFKISASTALGTTDTWIMTTAGERTMPLQPAFEVYMSAQVTNVTGNGASYLIGSTGTTWTENFDQGSDFDTTAANSRFTAPVTGRYAFYWAVRMSGLTTAMTNGFVTLSMTGQNHVTGSLNIGAAMNSSNIYSISGSAFTYMTAGDTAQLYIQITGAAGNTADLEGAAGANTYWGGHLVC